MIQLEIGCRPDGLRRVLSDIMKSSAGQTRALADLSAIINRDDLDADALRNAAARLESEALAAAQIARALYSAASNFRRPR